MNVPRLLQEAFGFVAGLAPELYELYRKTRGDLEKGRSHMRSMIAEIREDEAEIDAFLDDAQKKRGG